MVVGVIDIGTNTTRLLVAEVEGESVTPLLQHRHFATPAGAGARVLAHLLEREAETAREAGAEVVHTVGTASLRGSPEARRLDRACRRIGAGGLRILTEAEEAQLAFAGALAGEQGEVNGRVAVIDVGGGSTEIAVGAADGVEWWASRPVGSRRLTERALLSDPPGPSQLAAARHAVSRRFAGVEPPPCDLVLAVGGGAASLRRLCGDRLDRPTLTSTLERLCAGPSAELAAELDLDARRVRLLPAALVVFEQLCELFPEPLRIARGGMREGLALALAERAAPAAEGR